MPTELIPSELLARSMPFAPPSAPLVSAPDSDALTVAMAIAPGVYSRNRFFQLFKSPEFKRARARAAVVRGIVQHVVRLGKDGADVAACLRLERQSGRVAVSYSVPALRFERRTELSDLEASCLLYLVEKSGVPGLARFAPSAAQREGLRAALSRLEGGASALRLR